MHRGDHLFTHRGNHLSHVLRWSPFHAKVDCWSSPCWLLIGSTEFIAFSHVEVIAFDLWRVDPLFMCKGNCLDHPHRWSPFHMQRWLPFHMQRQLPFHAKVDCWSSLCQFSVSPPHPHPESTEAITFSCAEVITFSHKSWLLVLSAAIHHCPPRINRGNCLFKWRWKLTVDPLCSQLLIGPQGSTEAITYSCRGESWLLVLSAGVHRSPQHDQHTEMFNRFGAKVGKHLSIPCFTLQRTFPLGKSNKAQGQTLRFVGIYLPDHVFTHGQLYVAFSRVTDPSALAVCLNNPDGSTRNIVFQEVLWLSMYTLSKTMRSLCPQKFHGKHGSATSIYNN